MVKFERNILWCQGATPSAKSTLLVDGNTVSEIAEREAFSFLSMMSFSEIDTNYNWQTIFKSEKRRKWETYFPKTSPSFALFKNSEGDILVHSHFTNKDKSGRRIVYMFCSKAGSYGNASRQLIELSKTINRHPDSADIRFLKMRDFWNVCQYVIITCIILLILFVIWLINLNS